VRGVGVVTDNFLAQRGHLFLWVPVFLGVGIGFYFGLLSEPTLSATLACIAAAVLLALISLRAGAMNATLCLATALILSGVMVAQLRAMLVAAPVLTFRYYGAVEGRIIAVDRSGSDALRLTLDRVVLDNVPPDRTPARVRLSLQGDQRWLDPIPGAVVMLTGHLAPPSGPVEPGDFDFRLMAWFDQLGAVGYTSNPVLIRAPPGDGVWLAQLRSRLSAFVQSRIAGDAGGYAAAVMTGDRSGLSIPASDAMRDANLYHLVSISGMHMGMLVAIVFGLVRGGVALIPALALRVSAKKVAAVIALPIAAFYLALAGRDVATERAFVMVAVMLVAILLDRQALTLRSVAMAALIVLILRPESLINPGFQMSFAAVVALVAAFQLLAATPLADRRWRWIMPVFLVVFSSLVAGLATAPFAAAHFNRVAHFGLLANLLATPAMGLMVMPGGVLMLILAPLGLDWLAVWMVDLGSRWILWVSAWVAGMDGAISAVIAPPGTVVPLIATGGLILALWQGRARWAGLALPVVAGVLWLQTERPVLLIADSGGMVGVMTPAGRALSKPRGDGFSGDNWLENDGEVVAQEDAAARAGWVQVAEGREAVVAGLTLRMVSGEVRVAGLTDCGGADILIANAAAPANLGPCLVIDLPRLRQTGAIAGYADAGGVRFVTVAEVAGQRLWTRATDEPIPPIILPADAPLVADAAP
jgi:competence protein ComEC